MLVSVDGLGGAAVFTQAAIMQVDGGQVQSGVHPALPEMHTTRHQPGCAGWGVEEIEEVSEP